MKRKFKRVSKRTLSVILAIMMALSTMFVGIVSVDATNNGDNLYVYYGTESQFTSVSSKPMTYSSNLYTTVIDFTDVAGWTWYVLSISSSDSNRNVYWNDQPTITNNTQKITGLEFQNRDGYNNVVHFQTNGNASAGTSDLVKVTYDITANTITFDPGDSEPPTEPTTEPTTTSPTDPTTYYLGGRFKMKTAGGAPIDTYTGTQYEWATTESKNIQFNKTAEGIYELNTYSTVSELSALSQGNRPPFFIVHDGKNMFGGSSAYHTFQDNTSENKASLKSINNTDDESTLLRFDGTDESGNVIIHLDTNSGNKIWCTIDGGTDLTPGAITLSDDTAVNGSLSFKTEGKTSGTADVSDVVTITAKPFAGFTCSGITVSYTKPVTAPDAVPEKVTQDLTVTDNTATFAVPDVQPNKNNEKEISFAASFTLDKKAYLDSKGDGLWIDVAPDKEDTTATLIKWNNYYGHNHDESRNPYTFYVPKNVDLSNAKIYNGYNETVTVNGTQITAKSFGTVNLSYSGESGTFTTSKANIKVMQGSTNAMFLYTTKKGNETPLNTKTYAGWDDIYSGASKKDEKTDGGSCVTMFNDDTTTPEFSSAMSLDSVKGRGNSSWEASARRFGKYAYNMKLSDKTTLFGMAKDTKKGAGSKSWCLLANNADESMLRNALAYKLADDTGLYSSPEFSFVDIYDNGEYLGQYLVTEKVDVGESKLVYGTSIEDINEDAGLIFDEDPITGWIKNNASFTADGKTYSYEYRYTRETTGAESPDISKATYLLEFEIEDRYMDEACWFTTPQGQHVVIKTPEFATEAQVKYIAEKFIAMEAKVFADAENAELSKHIDLDSFARMYLVQELSANLDAASTSYYVTYDCSKGDNARFVASPVWDYDWAFGQYEKTDAKYDVNDKALDPKATGAWFAKNKKYDDSSINTARKYSIQSKLANNSSFQQVIKKVWDGTDTQEGFYAKVQKYYGDNSQLDAWYNKISASVNMNETRWGFIKDDNVKNWGSADNSDTHLGAVNWLESSFLSPRASWMNGEFEKYTAYTQIAAPTLTAYLADGKTELTGEVAVGDSIVLKADTTEIFVTYELYKNDEMVESNDNGVFTVLAENGTYEYTVKTLYGTNNRMESNDVTVTVNSVDIPVLERVSLRASAASITTGSSVTLTATPTPGDIEGCTYTFYHSTDNSNYTSFGQASTSNKATETLNEAGTYYYYVEATKDGKTVPSQTISVTVTEPISGIHDVTVYFKSASAFAYAPKVILNNGSEITMTKDQELGTIYSGALTIYWFKAVLTVDSKSINTLIFKTNRTSLNSSIKGNLSGQKYYFAADDIMNGSEIVDLTSQPEHIRNYYHTPLHMVYSSYESDKTLGFTNIGGKMYQLGAEVDEDGNIINSNATIDTVTTLQKSIVNLVDVSEVQNNLLDVNLDGSVDITDATMIQKVLAGI